MGSLKCTLLLKGGTVTESEEESWTRPLGRRVVVFLCKDVDCASVCVYRCRVPKHSFQTGVRHKLVHY